MSEKKKTTRKKIFDVIMYAVMAVLAVVIACSIYTKSTGKMVFSWNVLWVLSPSMETQIPEQSYILVQLVDAKNIKENDVITFYSRDPDLQGGLNTHRVIEIIGNNDEFITKGDNNIGPDNYHVFAEDVVARYVCNLPVLTFIGRAFATSGGLIITFVGIVFVVISWFYLDFMKKKLDEEKKKEMDKLVLEEVERLKRADNKDDALSDKEKEMQRLIAEEVERLKKADLEKNKKD